MTKVKNQKIFSLNIQSIYVVISNIHFVRFQFVQQVFFEQNLRQIIETKIRLIHHWTRCSKWRKKRLIKQICVSFVEFSFSHFLIELIFIRIQLIIEFLCKRSSVCCVRFFFINRSSSILIFSYTFRVVCVWNIDFFCVLSLVIRRNEWIDLAMKHLTRVLRREKRFFLFFFEARMFGLEQQTNDDDVDVDVDDDDDKRRRGSHH